MAKLDFKAIKKKWLLAGSPKEWFITAGMLGVVLVMYFVLWIANPRSGGLDMVIAWAILTFGSVINGFISRWARKRYGADERQTNQDK